MSNFGKTPDLTGGKNLSNNADPTKKVSEQKDQSIRGISGKTGSQDLKAQQSPAKIPGSQTTGLGSLASTQQPQAPSFLGNTSTDFRAREEAAKRARDGEVNQVKAQFGADLATNTIDSSQRPSGATSSLKNPDGRQSKDKKKVSINEKANKVNPAEEKQRELDNMKLRITRDEIEKHDPKMTIRDEFIKNEGELPVPSTSITSQQSLPIPGFDKVESPVKKSKKEAEKQRLKELQFSDVESAFYKPADKQALPMLKLQDDGKQQVLDKFVKNFQLSINELLKPVAGLPAKTSDSLVIKYGIQTPGHLNFEEFKKLYALASFMKLDKIDQELEGKIKQVFSKLDSKSTGRITKEEFKDMLNDQDFAWQLIQKIKNRISRGETRLISSLKIAFDGQDLNFNQNGMLPWPVFQTIMRDYGFQVSDQDKTELEIYDVLVKDEEGDFFVGYKKMLDLLRPMEKDTAEEDLLMATNMIQRCWRKFTDQKAKLPMVKKGQSEMSGEQKIKYLLGIGESGLGADESLLSPQSMITTGSKREKKTRANREKERLEQQMKARQDKRNANDLHGKMEQIVKVAKDAKSSGNFKMKKDIVDFIKGTLLGDILTKALAYGESLTVAKQVQTNFQTRPVLKNLFPTIKDFEYIVQGVQPKSLQAIDSHGEIMFLDNQNKLQRYEIASQKTKPNPMNLGTRPPLKHYPIIDMVSDQQSGRIYTLNANWILEIWDMNQQQESTEMEQTETDKGDSGSKFFPVKRIAVCNNEGGKDFINMFYRQTFNNSKPKFLSLEESNQQVLLVNTSCVDGSIVFIDPISFSVLKKVTLRYQDYEIPREVRKSILQMKQIFEKIQTEKKLTMHQVFNRCQDVEDDEGKIPIKNFVEQLILLEVDNTRQELFDVLQTLDTDNSGDISLEEFLNFFGEVKDESEMDDYAKAQEEQMIQDELWPAWLMREGRLQQAQNLFANMYHHLTNTHGIAMLSAFSLYDGADSGAIAEDQFKLILTIFFSDLLTIEETDFLMRLTVRRTDDRIFYKEFCKFMDKKIVKTFKDVAIRKSRQSHDEVQQEDDKVEQTPLEAMVNSPIRKEATLTYVLRKAAEQQKDLRKAFVLADPLELSVISRTEFNSLLIGMPLGLNQEELTEIFENDLNFDNYGNVDYLQILNSDIFVALERKRIKEKAQKRAAEYQRRRIQKQSIIANQKAERARMSKNRGLTDSMLTGEMSKMSTQQFSGTSKSSVLQEDSDELEFEDNQASMNLADNRKVVVEDLIYIDDLQIIIYSTISPRTSTCFVTSLAKIEPKSNKEEKNLQKPVALGDLTVKDVQQELKELEELKKQKKKKSKQDQEEDQLLTNHFELLAKLVGHKNQDPPSMLYVAESGCLVTGEKYQSKYYTEEERKDCQRMDIQGTVPTTYGTKKDTNVYDMYSKDHTKKNLKCEIIVWNLQKDLIDLFSVKPPWKVPIFKRFCAHDDSIVDIAYLPKAQILVSSSVDKSIRFWDPATTQYDLSDPAQLPVASKSPGNYKALKPEKTLKNTPYREVRRVYTRGNICFALQPLRIKDIILNPAQPQIKSSCEWIVCLSLGKPLPYHSNEAKAAQSGFLVGFGVERLHISVPANQHDQIVPPFINEQAQEMIQTRRAKIVEAFYKKLPKTLQETFESNQLQASQIEKVRQLFMQAILNRVEGKYVNPEPLREIYQIILKLPARNQFQGFLSSSGCSDKLSVSETFLYLQKFMQVHPLRTTQIEFEKSIQDFYYRHQRQYLQGIKRWGKQGLQKMANYVRIHGIDLGYFKGISDQSTDPFAQRLMLTFCTREKIQDYFEEVVKHNNKEQTDFTDEEIDLVLQELDPYSTGVIQINHIKMLFVEEITHYYDVKANKPQNILQKLRSEAFPAKRIALQKALSEVDKEGDGYISKEQFINAIAEAGIYMIRDDVEYLFDVMAEFYHKQPENKEKIDEKEEEEEAEAEEPNKMFTDKYLFLPFFKSKLYHKQELKDLNELDGTLCLLKSAMLYKNLEFEVIFAENYMEVNAMKKAKQRARDETEIDYSAMLKKIAKELDKEEFIKRVTTVQAQNVTDVQIRRLATYMTLNQTNTTVVTKQSWIHQLRRSKHTLHVTDRDCIPVMCCKLLRNLNSFQSQLNLVSVILKNTSPENRMCDASDLRQILCKWNFTHSSQQLFIEEFTRRGQVHIDSMIKRMKDIVKRHFASSLSLEQDPLLDQSIELLPLEARPRIKQEDKFAAQQDQFEPTSLEEIRGLPFAQKFLKKLARSGITVKELIQKFQSFDLSQTGQLPSHRIVGVLFHNFTAVFDSQTAMELQFELESLFGDHQIDYFEFIRVFFTLASSTSSKSKKDKESKMKEKVDKTKLKLERLMVELAEHVENQPGVDIANVVGLFGQQTGWLSYEQMEQVFKLIDYQINAKDFQMIVDYIDSNQDGMLKAHEIVDKLKYSQHVSSDYWSGRWEQSTFLLEGRHELLDTCQRHLPDLMNYMITHHSYTFKSNIDDEDEQKNIAVVKQASSVLTGAAFQSMLGEVIQSMPDNDIRLLTKFAIRGSQKTTDQETEKIRRGTSFNCDIENDLINIQNFGKSIQDAIRMIILEKQEQDSIAQNQLLGEEVDKRIDAQIMAFRRNFNLDQQDNIKSTSLTPEAKKHISDHLARAKELVAKIQEVFVKRECTFFDAFKDIYDPLAKVNRIPVYVFKDKVQKLRLPLTVQDQRVLRRLALDPDTIGHVDLKKFCPLFESVELKKMRLNRILDSIATQFYMKNFNLRKAFSVFDLNKTGKVSSKHFRQALLQLNLALSYDEVEDLVSMIDTYSNQVKSTRLDDDVEIYYDEFIMALSENLVKRKADMGEKIEDKIMKKLFDALSDAGQSLYDVLKNFDLEGTETILTTDLQRVMSKLGVPQLIPHIPWLIEVGNAGNREYEQAAPIMPKGVDIMHFSTTLLKEMSRRVERAQKSKFQTLVKLNNMMQQKQLSLFDLFVRLDKRGVGRLEKIELKNGIADMGMTLSSAEFETAWSAVHKFAKLTRQFNFSPKFSRDEGNRKIMKPSMFENTRPVVETVSYTDMIKAFKEAGCVETSRVVDKPELLLRKMRSQLRNLNFSVELAYKQYDSDGHGQVIKSDFKMVSEMIGLEFDELEMDKIFDFIADARSDPRMEEVDPRKNNGKAPVVQLNTTQKRFDKSQFMLRVDPPRDKKWLNHTMIRIHSVVLQRKLSYKRLFIEWQAKKPPRVKAPLPGQKKQEKKESYRITRAELNDGLKQLKCGLTQDEIKELTGRYLPYDEKTKTISAEDFKYIILQGIETLDPQEAYNKMILIKWINKFSKTLNESTSFNLSYLFHRFDESHKGGFVFKEFSNMNEYIHLGFDRKDLQKVFNCITKQAPKDGSNPQVRIQQIRLILEMDHTKDNGLNMTEIEQLPMFDQKLKKNQILVRQQVNEIYESLKNIIMTKNVTFDHILYNELNYLPVQTATEAGFQRACDKLGLSVTALNAKRIMGDLKNANNGKLECSWKQLIDFLTKARINVTYMDKGFVDPLLATSVNQLQLVAEFYSISMTQLFNVFDCDRSGDISKQEFIMNVQGMNINLTLEEILELFNFIDEKDANRITTTQFKQSMAYLMNKMSGQNLLESSQCAKNILASRKKVQNTALVFKIMSEICDELAKRQFTVKQLMLSMDLNKTGFISRPEFAKWVNSLIVTVPLESVRQMANFFDHKQEGKISIVEFTRLTQELMNQKVGGGVFLQMQAQPIVQSIINQLSVDCDKFFDELADFNEIELKEKQEIWNAEVSQLMNQTKAQVKLEINKQDQQSNKEYALLMKYKSKDNFNSDIPGLSKSVFFAQLNNYNIQLSEEDKIILSGVFSLDGPRGQHLMNYEKLDLVFEGQQQQLYSKKSLYTSEWERRIFSIIGKFAINNNLNFHGMFEMIKDDNMQTKKISEIKEILQQADLKLSKLDIDAFATRIFPKMPVKTGQAKNVDPSISQEEFISRFLSAFTYTNIQDTYKEKDFEEIMEKVANGPYAPPAIKVEEKKSKSVASPSNKLMLNRFNQSQGRSIETAYTEVELPQLELYPHNIVKASQKVISEQETRIKMLRVFKNVQNSIKNMMSVHEAFDKIASVRTVHEGEEVNEVKLDFITFWAFQANFASSLELSLNKDELRELFKEIDNDQNGLITFQEFEKFYQEDFVVKQIEQEEVSKVKNTQGEIFYHLLKVIYSRGLTLIELFDKIDVDNNGSIEAEEFHDLLSQMGFAVPQGQVLDLLRKIDDNFDGRVSYKELKLHLSGIGFNVDALEQGNQAIILQGERDKQREKAATEFVWRDKALEVIITKINQILKQKTQKIASVSDYFNIYDSDVDGYLSPPQFRQALIDMKEPHLLTIQIERMLHILLDHTQSRPLIKIARIESLLQNYRFLEMGDGKGSQSVLIDEDLFVYIVERYDGLSRFLYLNQMVEDRSSYLQRHVYELSLRGLQLMSNQKTVQVLQEKNRRLTELNQSALVLMSSEISRLIKDEAQLCCLDPTQNIDYIVTDMNQGSLASTSIPQIENTDFDIYWKTGTIMNNGSIRYNAEMMKNKQKVNIYVYPADVMAYVSQDGKTYKKHLLLEQQTQRYLMGAQFSQYSDSEDEDSGKQKGEDDPGEIFGTLGKFEKKVEAGTSNTDVYIINKVIDTNKWICFDDFVHQNGGLLNVPMLYHTDAPLFVIRYWAKLILKIITKLHDVSIILRCLNTKQLWFSRDGKKIKLGNVNGIGKINNFGCVKEACDLQINLENNGVFDIEEGIPLDGSKRPKKDRQKMFSNKAYDNPFLAPENLFSKFQDHTASMDVWGFGMVLYCLLLGKKPKSFYATYRDWYIKSHGVDLDEEEHMSGTFTRPSKTNFIYDPFGFDFENPFNAASSVDPEISSELMDQLRAFSQAAEKKDASIDTKPTGDFDFSNFMKCITQLSYSAMFNAENSTKFNLRNLEEITKARSQNIMPRFSGIQTASEQTRMQSYTRLASSEILGRKNELGLIIDTIASCLEIDPKKRPTIRGLLNSPLFQYDSNDQMHYQRLCQSAIMYRSPSSTVSMRITQPLRQICADAIEKPHSLYVNENAIQQLFCYAEDALKHISNMPLDEINSLVTMREKRRGLVDNAMNNLKGKDTGDYSVSPNAPLAAQIVKEHVVDMLLFITFRHMRNFGEYKAKRVAQVNKEARKMIEEYEEQLAIEQEQNNKLFVVTDKMASKFQQEANSKSVAQQAARKLELDRRVQNMLINSKKNHVLVSMTRLLKTIVHQMHAYNTPMAPYAREVLAYLVKFFTGEEHHFGSTVVLNRISAENVNEAPLKYFLDSHSFFRNEDHFSEDFKSDKVDKLWFLDQKNKDFLDKSNHWCLDLHNEAVKIYRDAIDEQGHGQSCYPVIRDYIKATTDDQEPSRVFSAQMNKLSQSFLTPTERSKDYYNELVPITESIARLNNTSPEKGQDKRTALAMIRSTFQMCNSDKIKACLDMRVPKHIIHFLQDPMMEVRQETLLILKEISKGLQDEDFQIMTKNAVNIKQEFTKSVFQQTAFDRHKPISMASQAEVLDEDYKQKRGRQSKQAKPLTDDEKQNKEFLKRIQLQEKEQNEKFIYFALDLPNLNFLACKPFLKELAVCFESPVFIAPLIRLLKTDSTKESFANKEIIIDIFKNLVCGNEKVLIALNSPACDTYMTLLGLLRRNQKAMNARASSSGMTSQIRHTLELQDKAIDLFKFVLEQRRPTILRDLMNINASEGLLKEQEINLPCAITLPDIMTQIDTWSDSWFMAKRIKIEPLMEKIQDLRCWIKHFFEKSKIPVLTRTKALQRCMNFLVHVFKLSWKDYFKTAPKETTHVKGAKLSLEEQRLVEAAKKAAQELPSEERKQHYILLMRQILQLFDWVLTQQHENFLFGQECGPENLQWVIETTNQVLSQFRTPNQGQITVDLESLTHDKKENRKIQQKRRFDIFPLTQHGAILQNIQYQLVRMNKPHTNELLRQANFGTILGQQLLLDYDFIGHCIDNCVESMVLLSSYVKKNEIRLNTIEFLLKSHENTLKEQFLKSNFLEKVMTNYVQDFREFNIQQSRIEVEFLAFRKGFPLRQEAISIFNTVLLCKQQAAQVYSEMIMHARRHKLVEQEARIIMQERITVKETTSLLLFAIILEVNEKDLIYMMQQENVPKRINEIMKEQPSLTKRFPILATHTTSLYSGQK